MREPPTPWPHSGRATPALREATASATRAYNRQAIQLSEAKRCSDEPSHFCPSECGSGRIGSDQWDLV